MMSIIATHRPLLSLFLFFLLVVVLLVIVIPAAAAAAAPEESCEPDDTPVGRFQQYLRFNTAHPNPNYRGPVSFLASIAASLSLQIQTLELAPGKPTLLLTWQGSDPSLPSLLFNSHLDSVPVEPSKWSHPPFSATRSPDGRIFSRGAQDDKCIGIQYLEAIRNLKENHPDFFPLRSLHLSFVPDEEVGGFDGMAKFVESPEFKALNVGFLLDEGQASVGEEFRVFYADRAPWELVIKAAGDPGHASRMYDNSAMENLMKSVEVISRFRESQFDVVKAGKASNSEVISVNPVYVKAGIPSPPNGFVMNMQPSEAEAGFDLRMPPTTDPELMMQYCAGIWHNAVCCAACGIALFLMPLFLCPFYVYGENPMVLDVPSTSPLSGYLSPGDVILALNGYHIQNEREWIMKTALMDKQTRQTSNDSAYSEELAVVYGRNSYCVPTSTIEEIQKIHLAENPSACPSDLTEFVSVQCNDISKLKDGSIDDDPPKIWVNSHCLNAKEVVKLSKCFDEIGTEMTNGSSCLCSQDELCLSPVQSPGLTWAEISYSSPYSPECLQPGRYSFSDSEATNLTEKNCGGTFVFVGDVISMAHSIQLTAYHPRWVFYFGAHLPNILERSLMCMFHVSLTLALLNSLPVYFLDGESILEVALCHFTSLGARKRTRVLQAFLLGGTLVSIIVFIRVFSINLL